MNVATADERRIGYAAVALITTLLPFVLLPVVDRFAYLPDDGAYAYVASRLIAGDVLNLHIQDVHLGYVNFANALALMVFGESLLALRYPLLVLTVLQAILIFKLLEHRGLVPACLSAAAMAGLTFVQFLNPTAHWYSLFLTVLLIFVLSNGGLLTARRLFAIGVLVGLIFGFRQLTGAIVGIATLVAVLDRLSRHERSDERAAALAILIPAFAVLALLLLRHTSPAFAALFGIWPLAVVILQMSQIRASNRTTLRAAGQMLGGFAAALLPLAAYHLWHGSLAIWWHDTVGAAISLSGMAFISAQSFGAMPLLIVESVAAAATVSAVINGLFWLTLLAVPVVLGFGLLRRWQRSGTAPPIAVVASFYCLVSLHYQIPIYLIYGSALALVALVYCAGPTGLSMSSGALAVAAFCVLVGATSHAARSPNDSLYAVFRGERSKTAVECELPRLKLRLRAEECNTYTRVLDVIDRHASDNDTILALPVNPEINFLSGRRSTLWFYNSALALLSERDLERALALIEKDPPAVIFYSRRDKYNSERTETLMKAIQGRYIALDPIAEFEVFRRADSHDHNAS